MLLSSKWYSNRILCKSAPCVPKNGTTTKSAPEKLFFEVVLSHYLLLKKKTNIEKNLKVITKLFIILIKTHSMIDKARGIDIYKLNLYVPNKAWIDAIILLQISKAAKKEDLAYIIDKQ